ncbi:MAG: hypothetical protein CNE89_10965 [Sphingomonadaceae bacterium MED-G03]|nr:MAG: hypothetical protein CNE89_10965 [Sphingomonadaceae bacterium MED-G03]
MNSVVLGVQMIRMLISGAILVSLTSVANAERYSVSLTRKDSNLYQVDGQKVFVMTKYCYHYGYGDDAVIDTDKREVFFLGYSPEKCDLEMILQQIG